MMRARDLGRDVRGRQLRFQRPGMRLLGAAGVVWGVVTAVFFIGAATGQNAAFAKLGPIASGQARAQFAEEHGLNDPILVQYVHYLDNLLHGDLGSSLVTNQPIADMIGQALPVTASLALLATAVSVVASTLLGCVSALTNGSWLDRAITVVCSVGQALPTFWVGILAIEFVAVDLHWLPSGGYAALSSGLWPWLQTLILPVLVLSWPYTGQMTRIIRASMVEELHKDYVRTARGLGLPMPTIMIRNVLRNGMVAPVTVFGLNIGGLFAGAVLVEAVFRLPGIGSLIVTAVSERDFGIVSAASIIAGIAFVVANLLADALQALLSPRPVGAL